MSDKISVIVPVYNAEKTLRVTLGNLLHQTYDNMELILVNDCSTDGSYRIMESAEKQFPEKVMIIDLEKNMGPGAARNVALMYATGDYLGFVDADDIVDVTMYEKLHNEAVQGDYDIVECGYFDEKKDESFLVLDDDSVGVLTNDCRARLIATGGYLWNKLYKRKLFENLNFRESYVLEDLDINDALILRAERVGIVKEILYKYCYYETSVSKLTEPIRYHRDTIDSLIALNEKVELYKNDLADYHLVREAADYVSISLLANAIAMLYKAKDTLDTDIWNTEFEEIRNIRNCKKDLNFDSNQFIAGRLGETEKKLIKRFDEEVKKSLM